MSDPVFIALIGACVTVITSTLSLVFTLINGRKADRIESQGARIEVHTDGMTKALQAASYKEGKADEKADNAAKP